MDSGVILEQKASTMGDMRAPEGATARRQHGTKNNEGSSLTVIMLFWGLKQFLGVSVMLDLFNLYTLKIILGTVFLDLGRLYQQCRPSFVVYLVTSFGQMTSSHGCHAALPT